MTAGPVAGKGSSGLSRARRASWATAPPCHFDARRARRDPPPGVGGPALRLSSPAAKRGLLPIPQGIATEEPERSARDPRFSRQAFPVPDRFRILVDGDDAPAVPRDLARFRSLAAAEIQGSAAREQGQEG